MSHRNNKAAKRAAKQIEQEAPPAEQEAPPAAPHIFAFGAYRVWRLGSEGKITYGTKDITKDLVAEGATAEPEFLERVATGLGTLALTRAGLTPRSKTRARQAIAAAKEPLLMN